MQALLDAIATVPFPADAGRLFHGRGGLFPGCEHLALDAYPPALLLTSFQPLADEDLATVGAALAARWPEAPWVYQCRQEGGRVDTRLMAGARTRRYSVSAWAVNVPPWRCQSSQTRLLLTAATASAPSMSSGEWMPR